MGFPWAMVLRIRHVKNTFQKWFFQFGQYTTKGTGYYKATKRKACGRGSSMRVGTRLKFLSTSKLYFR